jgi:hypothetical protein
VIILEGVPGYEGRLDLSNESVNGLGQAAVVRRLIVEEREVKRNVRFTPSCGERAA